MKPRPHSEPGENVQLPDLSDLRGTSAPTNQTTLMRKTRWDKLRWPHMTTLMRDELMDGTTMIPDRHNKSPRWWKTCLSSHRVDTWRQSWSKSKISMCHVSVSIWQHFYCKGFSLLNTTSCSGFKIKEKKSSLVLLVKSMSHHPNVCHLFIDQKLQHININTNYFQFCVSFHLSSIKRTKQFTSWSVKYYNPDYREFTTSMRLIISVQWSIQRRSVS